MIPRKEVCITPATFQFIICFSLFTKLLSICYILRKLRILFQDYTKHVLTKLYLIDKCCWNFNPDCIPGTMEVRKLSRSWKFHISRISVSFSIKSCSVTRMTYKVKEFIPMTLKFHRIFLSEWIRFPFSISRYPSYYWKCCYFWSSKILLYT